MKPNFVSKCKNTGSGHPKRIALAMFMFASLVLLAPASSFAQPEFCWKDSYGRGVGTVPQGCGPGQDRIGLLCYDKCPAGMERFGFDCHSVCPEGMDSQGLFCRRSEYGRGAGYPWLPGDTLLSLDDARSRCNKDNPQGCEKNGEIIYPKCKAGYSAFGCCICRPETPDCAALGLNPGIDLSCAKKVTIGNPVTADCSSGQEKDAGLCYQKCKPGYKGVGPVCWGQPPPAWVQCGMGAAKDSTTCGKIVFGQVTSVGSLALTIATAGGFGAAKSAATSTQKASQLAELKQKMSALIAAYKEIRPAVKAGTALYNEAQLVDYEQKGGNVTEEDIFRLAAQIAAIVDSSGVSDTVAAYTYSKCSKYGFSPTGAETTPLSVGPLDMACRSANDGGNPKDPEALKDSNLYFDLYKYGKENGQRSLAACQAACTAVGCTGVEYNTSNGRCELWKLPITDLVPSNGYSCYRTVFQATSNTACRAANNGGASQEPEAQKDSNKYFDLYKYENENGQRSLAACQASCKAGCVGVEYNESNGRCERWKVPITDVVPASGYACNRKSLK